MFIKVFQYKANCDWASSGLFFFNFFFSIKSIFGRVKNVQRSNDDDGIWTRVGGDRTTKSATFLSNILPIKILSTGSGCGSVGKPVASDTRGPRFESCHWRSFYWTLLTVNCVEKTKIKKKRPGMAHFFKILSTCPSIILFPWVIPLSGKCGIYGCYRV